MKVFDKNRKNKLQTIEIIDKEIIISFSGKTKMNVSDLDLELLPADPTLEHILAKIEEDFCNPADVITELDIGGLEMDISFADESIGSK